MRAGVWFSASILVFAWLISVPPGTSHADETPPPQTSAPPAGKQAEAVDVLKDAIDPFNEGVERSKFLKAAGVDSELSKEEFQTNQKSPNGFARFFDHWSLMASFDANRNKTVDWLEAHEYRRAILVALLAKFDGNKNGRLDGIERIWAQRFLSSGQLKVSFNNSCCGGRELFVPDPAARQRVTQLLSLHARRQGGAPLIPNEDRFLPFLHNVNSQDVCNALKLDERDDFVKLMTEPQRRTFERVVTDRLRWCLTGDRQAFLATMGANHEFATGKPLPDQPYADDHMIAQIRFGNLIERFGFGKSPIECGKRRLLDLLPPEARDKARQFPGADHEIEMVTVKLVARVAPFGTYFGVNSDKNDNIVEVIHAYEFDGSKSGQPFNYLGARVQPIMNPQVVLEDTQQ